ncbi:MAG: hypothetical protein JWN86_3323 [Planctomycetota bacterium]|nr:hypothetical protein [Planctomycetota bacterium]
MPRFRFTVRRMMVVVAIVAACLGWIVERHARFRRLSASHMSQAIEASGPDDPFHIALKIPSPEEEWRIGLAAKYARAARYPWLPVEPDPPEPK